MLRDLQAGTVYCEPTDWSSDEDTPCVPRKRLGQQGRASAPTKPVTKAATQVWMHACPCLSFTWGGRRKAKGCEV
jgi:hypothetical protein